MSRPDWVRSPDDAVRNALEEACGAGGMRAAGSVRRACAWCIISGSESSVSAYGRMEAHKR